LKQSTKTRVVFPGTISVDRIYLIDLEIKNTTDTTRFTAYLDLHLEIDSGDR